MTSRREEPIATIEAALDELLSTDPVYLTTVEKQHALTHVARLISRLQAFKLRVLAVADDAAEATGSRSAAGGSPTRHGRRTGPCAANPHSLPRSTRDGVRSAPLSRRAR